MAFKLFIIAVNVAFVAFFFGMCIFVHELGHLLVALWQRLYVKRFSIGFGKRLWGRTIGNVEYIVGALPFGGYVALPQLDPTDEPQAEDGVPLPQAPPSSRILTAAAGPVANVVFGFFLALFVWWLGVYEPAPSAECEVFSVPRVLPDYSGELRQTDRIIAVNDREVAGTDWASVSQAVPEGAQEVTLRVLRGDEALHIPYTPVPNPEYEAGLRPGDRIVAVNGKPFERGSEEMNNMITLSAGQVTLTIVRNDQQRDLRYRPAPNPQVEGLGFPFFHVRSPTVIREVLPGSPAATAGLQVGDLVLAVNGETVKDAADFRNRIRATQGRPIRVRIDRQGREMLITGLRARRETSADMVVYRVGVVPGLPLVLTHPTPWTQFVRVVDRTWSTLRALFAKGSRVKPRHMSGPIGIVNLIWMTVVLGGFVEGLSFIILVSFSLAFFNLLPIPVLDGGHIVYALVELVSRRRIPARLAYGLQTAFAVLLITFMLYVTFFDVKRIPKFWRALHPPAPVPELTRPSPQETEGDGRNEIRDSEAKTESGAEREP